MKNMNVTRNMNVAQVMDVTVLTNNDETRVIKNVVQINATHDTHYTYFVTLRFGQMLAKENELLEIPVHIKCIMSVLLHK